FRISSLSLTLSLSLICSAYSQSQSPSSRPGVALGSDESDLRALTEAFYQTWAAKDLNGWLRLWSSQAPEPEARQKVTAELYANTAMITLKSLAVRRVVVIGQKAPKAWLSVEIDMQVVDAQTGKEKAGYGKTLRALACVKEAGAWKVNHEIASFDALAEEVVATQDELERSAMLESLDDQTARATTLYQVGCLYRKRAKYELALSFLQRARDLSEASGARNQMRLVLQQMGDVRKLMGRYDEAFEAYRQSLTVAEEIKDRGSMADLRGKLATLYTLLGRDDSALAEIEQSLSIAKELGDTYLLALTLDRKGIIYNESGSYVQAIEMFQQALALGEKINATNIIDSCLTNLGITYRIRGNLRLALEYLRKSLKFAENEGDQAGIALTLNSMGIVYQIQGDLVVAMEYFNRSLALLGGAGGRTSMDVLQNIGDTLSLQENYEQAARFYGRALALAESSKDQPARARALIGMGEDYYQTRKYDEAAERFQQVLALNVRSINNEILTSMLDLGQVRYRQGDYAQALELANRANAINLEFETKEMTAAICELRGRVYVAMSDLRQARQAFDESIAALESLRADSVSDERGQSHFFERKLAAYHGAVALLIRQGRPAEALIYAERSKARVILDALRNGRVDIHSALTDEERSQENKFKETLFGLNRRIEEAGRSADGQPQKIKELREQLEKARLNYNVFLTDAYVAHPELKVQRGEAEVIQTKDLAALLPDARTALLEYVVMEDKTYLFVITRTAGAPAAGAQVYTLPVSRDELGKLIENLRRELAGRDLGFRAAARGLYQLLLKPAQDQLRDKTALVIAPDDKLWELPFQALLAGDGRYLIESAAVSYVPSLTVLREMKAERDRRQPAREAETAGYLLLALGNPVIGKGTIERAALTMRDENLAPLPEAEQEVKALGQLYGAARSRVYIGADAREDRLKAEAAQARVIHFATHGILDNASPMYSHLTLAQGDTNEDGLLEAWEIMQMDLKADLVVLSACETARGRFGAGEGMIGLSWALFIAGAPTIVVSQWKVESASTRDLMIEFHRDLTSPQAAKSKATKAEALRQAALKLMKNPETSHPFYWAGFALFGDAR
ncbi:MAG: CHAT domain-containing protein, partial [Chloracidobacterium sp.]|nr:CHAT domain-containing protein [Chloracidobacterium sp.]